MPPPMARHLPRLCHFHTQVQKTSSAIFPQKPAFSPNIPESFPGPSPPRKPEMPPSSFPAYVFMSSFSFILLTSLDPSTMGAPSGHPPPLESTGCCSSLRTPRVTAQGPLKCCFSSRREEPWRWWTQQHFMKGRVTAAT